MVCIGVPIKSRLERILEASTGIPESGWQGMGGTQPKDPKNLGGDFRGSVCEN